MGVAAMVEPRGLKMAFQRSGFQQSVSVTKDCWEFEPQPPPSLRGHTCTLVNILPRTWALMHRDPNGRGPWCSLRHKSHATQRHGREAWIYGWRSTQTHGILIRQVCVCVCPCADAAISGLLRAAEMLFLPIFFATDTKDPFTPIMHQHQPECISPLPFAVCLCQTR